MSERRIWYNLPMSGKSRNQAVRKGEKDDAGEKYNRSVKMRCPTCGGDQFEFEGEARALFNP